MTQRDNRRRSVQSQDGFISAQSHQTRGRHSQGLTSHDALRRNVSNRDASIHNRNMPSSSVRSSGTQRTSSRGAAHDAAVRRERSRNARVENSANYGGRSGSTYLPSSSQARISHARGTSARGADQRAYAIQKQSTRRQGTYSGAYPGNADQYSRYAASYAGRQTGMSRRKKVLITLLIIVLVIGIVGLGFFIYKEYQKDLLNKDLHGNMSKDELLAIDAELTGMTKFDEPFTVLLLGSDARAEDASMGARTDTIILVRIDPITNNITMLSLPRDTRVNIPGVGYEKLNAAYAYGGAKGTISMVKELCDIEIDHYAEINFEGLVGLIDAIGGIDVTVDETIDDPDAGDIVIPAGEQHLNGEAALVFSRSRAYVDGDYTRVSNQRKVIEAIIERGLHAPANELYGLVRQSADFLTTDSAMNIDFIFSLADQIRHNNDYPVTITTATLPSQAETIGGVSYVIADPQGIKDIMKIFEEGGDVAAFMEEYNAPSALSADTMSGTNSGYNTGYSSGYNSGYSSGYNSGYNSGYSTDYSSGYGSGTDSDSNYNTGMGTSIGTGTSTEYGSGTGSTN